MSLSVLINGLTRHPLLPHALHTILAMHGRHTRHTTAPNSLTLCVCLCLCLCLCDLSFRTVLQLRRRPSAVTMVSCGRQHRRTAGSGMGGR